MKLLNRLIKILSGVQTDTGPEISRLEHVAHFCVLVGKSFVRNRCPVRAAALSYTTLLALIPMLAVAIGVTSSILKDQGEKEIYAAIDKLVSNIMPPATSKTDSHGTSINLSPTAITVTRTNSVVSKVLTNSVANTNTTELAETTNIPASGTPVVSVNAQKAGGEKHPRICAEHAERHAGRDRNIVAGVRRHPDAREHRGDVQRHLGRAARTSLAFAHHSLLGDHHARPAAAGRGGRPRGQSVFFGDQGMPSSRTFIGDLIFQLLPLVLVVAAVRAGLYAGAQHEGQFWRGALGGIVGGSFWHVNNLFGFLYASRVVSNSIIYGSLGLLPVFMVGAVFFLGDFALRRAGCLRVSKPPNPICRTSLSKT